MKKEELEKLVEKIAQRTANIVMEQLKGKCQINIPGIDADEYVDSKEAARSHIPCKRLCLILETRW